MRGTIQRLLRTGLLRGGEYPTRLTSDPDLRTLFSGLRPVKPDQELIRLGPQGDGGYLVPDDLDDIRACYSPGVADVSGFERDCAERGMRVFMADYSVDGPAETHSLFDFRKKFLGASTDELHMTLDDWVESTTGKGDDDLLLQIDIEGAEYEVLLATSDSLMRRFRIIVAEFHQLHWLRSEPFCRMARPCFSKILQTHTCVHIHPNNCCGSETVAGLEIPRIAEFTFLRNDRLTQAEPATEFPHPQDCENTGNEALPLPRWWYA